MKAFRRGLAALLCVVLCVGVGCAAAGEKIDEAEGEARFERLLRFATERYDPEVYGEESEDASYAYLSTENYEQEKRGASRDYSKVEELALHSYNQAQFEEILPRVPDLRSLVLISCTVEDYSLLQKRAPQLVLSLEWQPDLLERVAVLPNLRGLALDEILDADLSPLTMLTELEELVLSFDSASSIAADLRPLNALSKLRSLKLKLFNADLSPLTGMTGLRSLTLEMSDADLSPLTALTGLRSLALELPVADLSPLSALTGLEELKLVLERDSPGNLQPLGALPKLRSLKLDRLMPSDVLLAETLPDMPALEELNLYGWIDLAQLAHTPALKRLYIKPEAIGDLAPLYTLPALNYLEFNAHYFDISDYVEQLEALHEAMPGLEIVFSGYY
jgi:hypothetical protein